MSELTEQRTDEKELLETKVLAWTQDKPAAVGLYLRSNPPISFICRQDVVEVDGALCTVHGCGDESSLILVEDLPDCFWYYGPIPQPPWKDAVTKGAVS
jgi:hypothetical protein